MARLKRNHLNSHALSLVSEKYREFFIVEERVCSSSKPVVLLKGECFEPFLEKLRDDTDIELELKVLVAILVSGGLRISECLMLQRTDFFEANDGSELRFFARVLKKRGEKLEREAIIHPVVQKMVREYLTKLRGFDHLFSFSRKAALHRLKSALGQSLDLHAFRHAFFSYLLFLKNMEIAEAAKLTRISLSTAIRYSHLNRSQVLSSLFTNGTIKKAG